MKKNTEAQKQECGYRESQQDKRPNKENEPDNRRILLAITVEIEDGCVEHIEMKEGDSAEAVASKFCSDHSLPEQFVAPLTEHIVSNIVSLSREDNEPSDHEKEDPRSCETPRLYQGSNPSNKNTGHSPSRREPGFGQDGVSRSCCKPRGDEGMQAGRQLRNAGVASQSKKQTKTKRRLSERLLAPTLTSLARTQAPERDKSKDLANMIQRPLTDKAKAVYMRLYAEFLRQKQRSEIEKVRNMEMYQEKLERNRAYVSKKSWRIWRMRGRTAKQYCNYGELLYSEGLTKMEQLKKMVEKKQKEDEAKELKELTLKPEISKRAKQLRRDQGQIWHRLQTADKPRQDQLQELRNEIWEAKLMECTFKPRINRRRLSQKLLNDGSTNRFEQLFLDAENRRRRQAEYTQWYPEGVTFQPHINRQRQAHGLDRDDGFYREATVFDRLLNYASKLTEKKQMWQQIAAKPVDAATGQELFTPVTGRKPLYDRNTSDLPIGEFLYQLKDTMDRKKQWLAERDMQTKKEQASCQYVGSRSQKLLDSIKERRIHQIFDYLDKDKDGFVELGTADLNQLSDDAIEDVARLREMGGEKPIDFESFVSSMKAIQEKARKTGTVHLVLKHKKHDLPMHFQFKMDRYSRNLAVRRRRFSSSRQWYKIILADRAKWQSDIEALRKERQSLEMKECTFRPEIQKKRAHLKVLRGREGRERMGPPASHPFSKIREKEQREMHGFIFEEDINHGSERLGKAASGVSHDTRNHVESQSRNAGDMTPMVLLESLKSLRQIVAQPESTEEGSPQLFHGGRDGQEVSYERRHYHWRQQRPEVEQYIQSSVVNDLPDPEGNKDGLFVGLLGA